MVMVQDGNTGRTRPLPMDTDPATFLADAAQRSPDDYVKLRIRDLLSLWGYERRGYWIVEQIKRELNDYDLTTVPWFEDGWIENKITLLPISDVTGDGRERSTDFEPDRRPSPAPEAQDVALRVRSLKSANGGVESITPQQPLGLAKSIMLRCDYSQLAVMSGKRDLVGAVSWESIGKAAIRAPEPSLADAQIPARLVDADDDLIARVPDIIDEGFIFVKAPDRSVSGIVTMADLSTQFTTLARPFFLLREIEQRLRHVVNSHFTPADIEWARDPDDDRKVRCADDLTIGELARLFEKPDCWSRLDWTVERQVFVDALHGVREIRNDIMHFSPDPLSDAELEMLRAFIKWLRTLEPSP